MHVHSQDTKCDMTYASVGNVVIALDPNAENSALASFC